MKIEKITLKNFRAFKNMEMKKIPRLCVLVGANGSGKSTFFQVFGFLQKAMKDNVSIALRSLGGAKGFSEVRSRNSIGPIEISIQFRESADKPLLTYELHIDEKEAGKPFVAKEILRYRRGQRGKPWDFLNFTNGKGYAVNNELDLGDGVRIEDLKREEQTLKSPDILAIKGLGQFAKFPAVKVLSDLIEKWHISDFHIADAKIDARLDAEVASAEHLSTTGDNLALVTDYLSQNHKDTFASILKTLPERVPGINMVEAKTTEDGKVLLRFGDSSFKEPFLARNVSDGTIKMFAYLILLNDPAPHPLLCIEEPENQLYPSLLPELAEEFRNYASRGQQVFISTHSYDFLNAINLEEAFLLVKKDGYTTIQRAQDIEQIKSMMDEGDKLGRLWRMGYFEGVNP